MKVLSKIYTGLIFFFLYSPIMVLIVFSFNNSKSRSVWMGFTTKWYTELFRDTEVLRALSVTLMVAAVTAAVSTIIGTMASIGLNSMKPRSRSFMLAVNNIPVVNPEIVTGVALMLMFTFVFKATGMFQLGLTTMILSHITFATPYVILSIMPKLRQMNRHLYEAAQDLGATPIQAFFKVVIPEIMPGIVTGAIMAFTLSIDDFVISYFTSGTDASTQTLSLYIAGKIKKRIPPTINAVSTLLFLTIFILLIVVNIRNNKDVKHKKGE